MTKPLIMVKFFNRHYISTGDTLKWKANKDIDSF